MDPGRYVMHQGWENNSALEGYNAVEGSEFRDGGSHGDRRHVDRGYPRDDLYPRGFHRDVPERDNYHPPNAVRDCPQMRRRTYEEDYSQARDSRRITDGYCDVDDSRDYGYNCSGRFEGREHIDYSSDEYEYRHRGSQQSREDSRERDGSFSRYDYDSDYDGGRRDFQDSGWKQRGSHDRERDKRGLSWEKDASSYWRQHERSHSRGRDDRPRSRSPRTYSYGRGRREDSYEDSRYDRGNRQRDRDDKHYNDRSSVAPSATLVVKGLSQKTTEEDLYQILSEWGPLRHVRVIKERNSGASRGFAFIDFPSVAAARNMMDGIEVEGLVVDSRKLLFEYSSRPTGSSGPFGHESASRTGHGHGRNSAPFDWMCTLCGYVNFARRTSCFQCNEARADDAPAADVTPSNSSASVRRGMDAGPTHVLVVRGLDENADEDMIRYEFSKHAPIKDLRLVRDKFTHVSRGFAFVHFHSVEDATKALEATNGTTLERNGQVLRVAYAKSIHGPGSSGTSQSSTLAAAAIEAATFAQQYDAVGWAPKEYNPDDKQSTGGSGQGNNDNVQKGGSAPQSGFVWDEASGYYYDSASGFYYDGNTGLYYDGNSGIWYSYDQQTQQYIPCNNENHNASNGKSGEESGKSSDRKVVISAPAAIVASNDRASLPDAVQAAATAALAAEKREKEKQKELRLASKSSILANKKKMNNVLNMWKQRNNEGQPERVVLEGNQTLSSMDDKTGLSNMLGNQTSSLTSKNKIKPDINKETLTTSTPVDSQAKARPIMGVIRGSGRGVIKSDTTYLGTLGANDSNVTCASASVSETQANMAPFRTDASALGSYTTPGAGGTAKRRFSETPQQAGNTREPLQTPTMYRDRAAERRSLYGSSSSAGNDFSDDPNLEVSTRKGIDAGGMPFPPGVGGRGELSSVQDYDVITTDKAIDEKNVGNRMLRSMGWQEGLGLGKDGSGITAPVMAQSVDTRAGLGSQQRKVVDPSLEVQAGDSYRMLIQKKAIARFREMS